MTHNNRMAYAALALAGAALVVSLYSAARGPGAGPVAAGGECVDRTARDQADQLRRALAARDAVVARLVRDGAASGGAAASEPVPAAGPAEPADPTEPAAARRFVRFEAANPAVTVTQKPDGSYDIQTRDPSLVGQVVQVVAVTASGEETRLLVRIPAR